MPDHSSFGCMQSCSSKFELRLQLDSSSIAAVNQAITGGMREVAVTITQAMDRLKRSMHDLGYYQREALERSTEMHFLLTRAVQQELESLRRPPQQPAHPPPPQLLQQQQQQQQANPPGPSPPYLAPTVPKPKGSRSLQPRRRQAATAKVQKPLVPKYQASSARPPLQKPLPPQSQAKTQDFHLHHVLVVIQQTCSLH